MSKYLLETKSFPDEDGVLRHYDYYILIDEVEGPLIGPNEICGLEILEQERSISCNVPNITTNSPSFDEICHIVVDGNVTPLTLKEVVHNWQQNHLL